MSSPEEQPLFEEPLSPIGRMQSGFAALFVTPSPKKMMKMAADLLMSNLSLMRESHQAQWLQKVI
jgi:hypothetical protein